MRTNGIDPRTGRHTPRTAGASRLYHQLRQEILDLQLPPGHALDETALAERFAHSGTTVREALLNLSADRLVELLPNRGARVAQLDFVQLPRLLEALDLVGRAIAGYAAHRRTDTDVTAVTAALRVLDAQMDSAEPAALTAYDRAFHMAVAQAADNSYLGEAYCRLFDEGLRMIHLAFSHERTGPQARREYLDRMSTTHHTLVEAIGSGAATAAQEAARARAEALRERIFAYLQPDPATGLDVGPLPSMGIEAHQV